MGFTQTSEIAHLHSDALGGEQGHLHCPSQALPGAMERAPQPSRVGRREAEAVPDLGPVGGSRDKMVRRAGQTRGPQIYRAHNSPSKLFQTQVPIQEI